MSDPILEELWRVREELLKKHGGIDGYFAYVQKFDRARRQRGKGSRAKKARKVKVKSAT